MKHFISRNWLWCIVVANLVGLLLSTPSSAQMCVGEWCWGEEAGYIPTGITGAIPRYQLNNLWTLMITKKGTGVPLDKAFQVLDTWEDGSRKMLRPAWVHTSKRIWVYRHPARQLQHPDSPSRCIKLQADNTSTLLTSVTEINCPPKRKSE